MFIGSNKDDDYIYSAEYSVNCAVRLKTATWLTKYLCMIQPNADITHILQSVINTSTQWTSGEKHAGHFWEKFVKHEIIQKKVLTAKS